MAAVIRMIMRTIVTNEVTDKVIMMTNGGDGRNED